jgi:hypothetical protein
VSYWKRRWSYWIAKMNRDIAATDRVWTMPAAGPFVPAIRSSGALKVLRRLQTMHSVTRAGEGAGG